ncbi:hypothetical protein ACFO9Q_08485 [Paenibacillus sp. GCM10023252]|uniref:hypothetical protein n=1 Tax=Paenibacillus sp. GCM10023252 TaxID=3252649 RepID=UPI0036153CF7
MVLEAALVMPLLIIGIIVFVYMIKLASVQMALESAASQTVRQTAAHIRPIELALQKTSTAIGQLAPAQQMPMPMADWTDAAAEAAGWLPAPVGPILSSALQGNWKPLQDAAATELGASVVEPLLREVADEHVLDKQRMKLSRLQLPDLQSKEEPYLMVEISYEFPLRLPWRKGPLILKERAEERVWVSDAAPAVTDSEGEGAAGLLQIVSIQPSPITRGSRATVVARAAPGETVSLDVLYKSGHSTAKHLGRATADAEGYVKWTWLVSGNTTPGVWELTASASGKSVSMHFTVERPPKRGE